MMAQLMNRVEILTEQVQGLVRRNRGDDVTQNNWERGRLRTTRSQAQDMRRPRGGEDIRKINYQDYPRGVKRTYSSSCEGERNSKRPLHERKGNHQTDAIFMLGRCLCCGRIGHYKKE